jgi:serine/threonine protein kinase
MPVQGEALLAERFQLESVAGSGGMGTVYQALDRQSGERVAVKLLGGGGSIDARAQQGAAADSKRGDLDRFLREAQVLAQLDHPGIVRYLTHGQTGSGQA